MNKKSNCCHKCNQIIYEKDKFGPVNSNIYHKSCFKCLICDTSLTLKSYTTSQANINDKEVYCNSHAPKASQIQRTTKFERINDNQFSKEPTSKLKHTTSEEYLLDAVSKTEIVDKNNPINIEKNIVRRLSNASIAVPIKTSNPNIPSFNEGKVTMLTRKWNSRESLLDSGAQKPPAANQNITFKQPNQNINKEKEIEMGNLKNEIINIEDSKNFEITKSIPDLKNIATSCQQTQDTNTSKGIHRQYTSSPKFIIDDLGGGISYTKYMEEIKRRQHNTSDQKRNITDLYLKSPGSSKKSGSTGDIMLELTSRKNEKQVITSNNKNRLDVNDLISDELNFYKSFNNASKSLNKDLDKYESRQSIMLSRDKLTNNNRYVSCEEEILENIIVDESNNQTIDDNNTKIIVDFKTDGHSSNVLIQNNNNLSIRTLSRDSSRRNDSNYSFTKSSRENLTERRDASPENFLNQSTLQNPPEITRTIGSLMISYMFRNDEFFITIQKAKNIFKDKDKPLDTFVTMMILPDPRKQTTSTTSVALNSVNPEWNQTFVYGISYGAIKTKYIYISIKDHKMASKLQSELSESLQHEALKLISLGECLMCLSDIRENVYYEMWCNLKEPSEVQNVIATKEL